MNAQLTPLGIMALALLFEKQMHPYEMYTLLMARREDRLVKVRPGSLYHTVQRLERDKLITATGTDREGGRPERTVYAITDAGMAAVQEWVSQTLAEQQQEYPRFPVALAEAHNLERETVMDLLSRQLAHLESECSEYDAAIFDLRSRTSSPVPEAYWIEATYRLAILKAQRDWVAETIRRLTSKELPWPRTDAEHSRHHDQQP